jgi:hypothetical protein
MSSMVHVRSITKYGAGCRESGWWSKHQAAEDRGLLRVNSAANVTPRRCQKLGPIAGQHFSVQPNPWQAPRYFC